MNKAITIIHGWRTAQFMLHIHTYIHVWYITYVSTLYTTCNYCCGYYCSSVHTVWYIRFTTGYWLLCMIQLTYKLTPKHISAASRNVHSKGMGLWLNLFYNLIIRHCTHPWSTLAQIFTSRAVPIIELAKYLSPIWVFQPILEIDTTVTRTDITSDIHIMQICT